MRAIPKSCAIAFALMLAALCTLACHPPAPGPTSPTVAQASSAIRPAAPSLIHVGTSGDYPPFSHWPAEMNEPEGFSVDLARAWARDEGYRIEWVRFVWAELAQDLESQRFDVAFSGVTVRPDRSISGRFGLPVTVSGAVALVEESGAIHTRADLEEATRSIAVNAGGHLERVTRALFPRAEIRPVARNRDVLAQLGHAGIEAVMTDTLEAPLWLATRRGLRALGPLTHDRKAAWFSRSSAEQAKRHDQWLMVTEATGTLARLRQRHGLPDEATARPTDALVARLDERLSLMTAVARSKQIRDAPVEDPAREARVLESAVRAVRAEALGSGGQAPPEDAVLRFYRAQIEAAKWIQRDWIARHPVGRAAPTADDRRRAQDRLEEQIRPALLFLGDRIAALVFDASKEVGASSRPAPGFGPRPTHEHLASALARHHLPEVYVLELHEALLALGIHRP